MKEEKKQSAVDSLELASERSFALNRKKSETLVIYCADPRFRSAFQEFIRIELGIGHHTLLSLAGGAGPFVLFKPESLQASQMAEQLRIFIMNNEIKEVVVLNHSDCKWYAKLLPDDDSNRIIDIQIADLQRFAGRVRSDIADVPVRAFLAVLQGEKVCFRKVVID